MAKTEELSSLLSLPTNIKDQHKIASLPDTDISLKVTLKRMLTQEKEIRTRLSNAAKLVKKYDPSAAAMSSEISQINC